MLKFITDFFQKLVNQDINPNTNFIKYSKTPRIDFYLISRNPKIYDIWNYKWHIKIHKTSDQFWRRQRALEKNQALYIDIIELEGKFLGSLGEVYDTTLKRCDCEDFKRRWLPCKHMYRLYYELEQGNSISIADGVAYAHSISQIKNAPKDSLILFCEIAKNIRDNKVYFSKINKDITYLLDNGLIAQKAEKDYISLLNSMTKDNIILALAKKSVTDYKPSWSKSKLINWIVDNEEDFLAKHYKKVFFYEPTDGSMDFMQNLFPNFKFNLQRTN